MKYIGRYKDGTNYQDIVNDISFLSTATHLEFVKMFIFETEDKILVHLIRNHASVIYVQEDHEVVGHAVDSNIKHVPPDKEILIEDEILVDTGEAVLDDKGTVSTSSLAYVSGGNYYYWHLEQLNKKNPATVNHTYSYTKDGTNVDVYIVDTGIRYEHPHIAGRAQKIPNACGYLGTDGTGNHIDGHSHGTNCSNCAAGYGAGINSNYGAGVAKNASIWGVKVLSDAGSGSTSNIVSGINSVIAHNNSGHAGYKGNNNPAVINFSIGHSKPHDSSALVYTDITGSRGDGNDAGEDALKTAANSGIHVVQSAGNGFTNSAGNVLHGPLMSRWNYGMISLSTAETDTQNTDPGQGMPICVGATQESPLNMANFTNYGKANTINAPGKYVRVPNWYLYRDTPGVLGSDTSVSVTAGHQISIDGTTVTMTGTTLTTCINDINNASISGVTAESFYNGGNCLLILKTSGTLTIANVSGTVLTDVGITANSYTSIRYHSAISGTSFSGPITAGLVALRAQDEPTESPTDTKTWLTSDGATDNIIADLTTETTLASNPLSMTNGSATVTVDVSSHGLSVGNKFQLTGATLTQGIPDIFLNDWHTVTATPTANTVQFTASTTASTTPILDHWGESSVQATYMSSDEDYLIVAEGAELKLYDWTDPLNPSFIKSIVFDGTIQDMQGDYDKLNAGTDQSFLFVCGSFGVASVWIHNMWDMRLHDIETCSSQAGGPIQEATGIDHCIVDAAEYLVVSDKLKGVWMIQVNNGTFVGPTGNVFDTTAVVNVGVPASDKKPVEALDVTVSRNNSYAYIANYGGGLRVVDISNPSSLSLGNYIYELSPGNPNEYITPRRLGEEKNYGTPTLLYAIGESVNAPGTQPEAYVMKFDISNPATPTLSTRTALGVNTIGTSLAVQQGLDRGFVGLQKQDGTGEVQKIELTGLTKTGIPLATGPIMNISIGDESNSNLYDIFCGDFDQGLHVITFNNVNPNPLTTRTTHAKTGNSHWISYNGTDKFASTIDYQGIKLLDSNLSVTGTYTSAFAEGTAWSGNTLGVAAKTSVIFLDCSTPASISLSGTDTSASNAVDIAINGNYAYVLDQTFGLRILDISNLSSISASGTLDCSGIGGFVGRSLSLDSANNEVYIAGDAGGVIVIDVSNPASPSQIRNIAMVGTATCQAVYRTASGLIHSAEGIGITIYNSSGNTVGSLANTLSSDVTQGISEGVSNTVLTLNSISGIKKIDVSTPTSPSLSVTHNIDDAKDLVLNGTSVYVADGSNGVLELSADLTTGLGGGTAIKYAKLTGQFELTDGIKAWGNELRSVQNNGYTKHINTDTVEMTDNKFVYSPYQDYTATWAVANGTLATVTSGDVVSHTLTSTLQTAVSENPFSNTYSISVGTIPDGTSFNTSTGVLDGTTTTSGNYSFTVTANNGYATADKAYTLEVQSAGPQISIGGGITLTGGITINT